MGSGCGSWPNPSCLGARAVEHDGNRINPMKSARYLPRLDAAESDSLVPTAHAPPRRPRTLGATGARRRCSHCQTAMGSRHHPSAAHAGRRRAALLLSADCARPEPVPRGRHARSAAASARSRPRRAACHHTALRRPRAIKPPPHAATPSPCQIPATQYSHQVALAHHIHISQSRNFFF